MSELLTAYQISELRRESKDTTDIYLGTMNMVAKEFHKILDSHETIRATLATRDTEIARLREENEALTKFSEDTAAENARLSTEECNHAETKAQLAELRGLADEMQGALLGHDYRDLTDIEILQTNNRNIATRTALIAYAKWKESNPV
jgi:ABC-type multidrug transport system fused ATPase/permease subunit